MSGRRVFFVAAAIILASNVAASIAWPAHHGSNASSASERTWKITAGKYAGEYKGKVASVKNTEVSLLLKEKRTVTDVTYKQQKAGVVRSRSGVLTMRGAGVVPVAHNRTADYTETIHIALKLFAKQDRLLIEKDYPAECVLSKRSVIGDIGILSTKDGSFFIEKKIDAKTAVVALVVDGETKWTFMLRSNLLSSLKEDATHAGKGADAFGLDKKTPTDFVFKEKRTYEDDRLPFFTEAD